MLDLDTTSPSMPQPSSQPRGVDEAARRLGGSLVGSFGSRLSSPELSVIEVSIEEQRRKLLDEREALRVRRLSPGPARSPRWRSPS